MRKRRHISHAAQQRRARTVAQHIKRYGLVCPGHKRAPHRVDHKSQLTADHIKPLHAGGFEGGALRVLCKSCNSSRSRMGSLGRRDKPTRNSTHKSIFD